MKIFRQHETFDHVLIIIKFILVLSLNTFKCMVYLKYGTYLINGNLYTN